MSTLVNAWTNPNSKTKPYLCWKTATVECLKYGLWRGNLSGRFHKQPLHSRWTNTENEEKKKMHIMGISSINNSIFHESTSSLQAANSTSISCYWTVWHSNCVNRELYCFEMFLELYSSLCWKLITFLMR